MTQYHKIQTVLKRDPDNNYQVIEGEYSLPEFEYLADCKWMFTEKIDGTNIRLMWDGSDVKIGGKTDRAQIPVPLLEKLMSSYVSIDRFTEAFGAEGDVCLYGEGYGAGIQKGGSYIPDGCDFILFDVKIGEWWLERENVWSIANKLGLETVPEISTGTLPRMIELVRAGIISVWGDFPAEGIVARPVVELFSRNRHRIITKLKHKDFK